MKIIHLYNKQIKNMDIDKEIQKLTVSEKQMIEETFRTVQHIDIKVNVLIGLLSASLTQEPLNDEVISKLTDSSMQHSALKKLQALIQKYG